MGEILQPSILVKREREKKREREREKITTHFLDMITKAVTEAKHKYHLKLTKLNKKAYIKLPKKRLKCIQNLIINQAVDNIWNDKINKLINNEYDSVYAETTEDLRNKVLDYIDPHRRIIIDPINNIITELKLKLIQIANLKDLIEKNTLTNQIIDKYAQKLFRQRHPELTIDEIKCPDLQTYIKGLKKESYQYKINIMNWNELSSLNHSWWEQYDGFIFCYKQEILKYL